MKKIFLLKQKLILFTIVILTFQSLGGPFTESNVLNSLIVLKEPNINEKQDIINKIISNTEIGDLKTLNPIDKIIINNNNDFLLYSSRGNGTKENPYIIENFIFRTNASGTAIQISNTDKYFLLKNVEVDDWNIGISLFNVKNGMIENNTVSYSDWGIKLNRSSTISLVNNTVYIGKNYGIYLIESSNNNLESNRVIFDHTIYGRRLFDYGLVLEDSPDNIIINTNMTSAGLWITGSYYTLRQLSFKNNSILNRPIIFLQDITNEIINSSAAQIILLNCSYIIIKNQNMRSVPVGIGIYYGFNSTIKNNQVSDSQYGLYIQNTNNSLFKNNSITTFDLGSQTIRNNGFYFLKSNQNIIENNTVQVQIYGFYFDHSYDSVVRKNSIKMLGIYNTVGYCFKSTFSNNKFVNNKCDDPNHPEIGAILIKILIIVGIGGMVIVTIVVIRGIKHN